MRYNNKQKVKINFLIWIILGLLSGCFSQETSNRPEVEVLSVQQNYPIARELAKGWNSKAVLMQVKLLAIVDGYLEKSNFITYRFEVPGNDKTYLSIKCSESTCSDSEHSVTTVGDTIFQLSEMGYSPINVQDINIDSTDAVHIAIADRELDLRKAPVRINVVLTRDENLHLFWFIIYYSPSEYIVTKVDPFSGNSFDGNS